MAAIIAAAGHPTLEQEVGQQRAGKDRERQPDEQQSLGRPSSPSTSRSRTVDASENRSRARSVHDVRTVSLVSERGKHPARPRPRIAPAATNTMGGNPPPVELRRHQRVATMMTRAR